MTPGLAKTKVIACENRERTKMERSRNVKLFLNWQSEERFHKWNSECNQIRIRTFSKIDSDVGYVYNLPLMKTFRGMKTYRSSVRTERSGYIGDVIRTSCSWRDSGSARVQRSALMTASHMRQEAPF